MKKLLTLAFALVCFSGLGQSLQWRNLYTGQFNSNNFMLSIKGAGLTNLSAANITAGGTLPALNGSALTALSAAALSSGTVDNARLNQHFLFGSRAANYTVLPTISAGSAGAFFHPNDGRPESLGTAALAIPCVTTISNITLCWSFPAIGTGTNLTMMLYSNEVIVSSVTLNGPVNGTGSFIQTVTNQSVALSFPASTRLALTFTNSSGANIAACYFNWAFSGH